MKAKTIQGNSAANIRQALQESMGDGFRPTIAIVFISIKQDRDAISEILDAQGIDILGATSSGEFTEGHQSTGEIAIMLLDIPKEYYSVVFGAIGEGSLEEAAGRLVNAAFDAFENPAIILLSTMLTADGNALDGEDVILNIVKVAGPQLNMFGGMAGDDITFTGTYIFTNNKSTDYGMVALVLNEDKVGLQGVAISGWKPVGIYRTVTESKGSRIYTIDDKPAIDIYMRYLGHDKSSTEDQVDFFHAVGVHYPFQIERENRAAKMCNPIGYDKEDEALICESNVPQGSQFRFSTPPDFDIIETVVDGAQQLKKDTAGQAIALLVFSCAGRLSALGPMAEDENQGLHEVWNVPMVGFYTYGEFGRGPDGKHDFHSTTNSWVALIEK